jgi:hypothetical protein
MMGFRRQLWSCNIQAEDGDEDGDGDGDGDGEDVLEGIRRATSILQHDALLQSHGHLLEDPAFLRPDTLESLTNAQYVRFQSPLPQETSSDACGELLPYSGSLTFCRAQNTAVGSCLDVCVFSHCSVSSAKYGSYFEEKVRGKE